MRNQHNITAVGVADTAPAATGRPAPSVAQNSAGTDAQPAPGTARRLHAGILLLAPAVMAAGLLYHPAVGDPIDPDFLNRLGAAVRANTVRWAVAHHLVAVGSGLLALAAIFPWFIPTLYASALLFAAGSFIFARGIVRSGALNGRLAAFVALALVAAAACRLIPINLIHMDVQAVAGLLALWPLAYVIWNDTWRRTS